MKPLIRIETVPISIEMRTNNARFERVGQTANLEITRNKGGLTIRSQPIKLNMDTFEARNSVVPTTMRSNYQAAQDGKNAAYEATARIAEEGRMLVNIHLNQDAFSQIAANRVAQSSEFALAFSPEVGPNINWDQGDISIMYEMDRLNFDFKLQNEDYKFIPGDIEFNIKEYNRVIIEYIGGPIYVPPSSDPDYVPIDTRG